MGILKNKFKSLRQNEFESFQRDGFAKVGHKIFTDTDFHTLKTTVNEILIKRNNKATSVPIGNLQFAHPEILYWILSDNVLDIAEDFLGPNVGLLNSTVFYKKSNTEDKAYWHTDTGGFERYQLFEDPKLINLTIALTKADKQNGCLKYIPGTHSRKFQHDYVAPLNDLIKNPSSINEENLDLTSVKYLELSENEASVHNVHAVHGSDPNPSDEDRITLSIRFFSASTRCNVENFKNNNVLLRPILVRGVDAASSGLPFFSIK
jgi:ectoine hydroxylase-related dioxygenase (phytanoyl-CoA dioxygenase family)